MAGEGSLQRYFKRRCKECGVLWYKVRFEGVRGCPDTLIAKDGSLMLVELKNMNGRGRLSKQQERRIAEIRLAGIEVRVIDSREGVDNVIEEISDGRVLAR